MSCYWAARDQPRMLRARHAAECIEAAWHPPLTWVDCAGCQPCEELHCLLQWHGDRGDCETHAVTVCPSCVGKVREHLTEIARLAGAPIVAEALSKGIDSEAADLLGPAANPAAWRQRGRYGHRYEPDSREGELHPEWVLGRFDLLVTEHLGHTRTTRVTVASAADYLGRNLHYLAADLEFDFPDMASDLADCRAHLDRVLHDGEQVETGAPCMTCRVPLRLVRGERDDRWSCPRCRQESSEDQYRFALKQDFIENADELNVDDMAVRVGLASSTLRRWAGSLRVQRAGEKPADLPPILEPAGVVAGRKVYAVADVLAIKDGGGDTRRGDYLRRAEQPA